MNKRRNASIQKIATRLIACGTLSYLVVNLVFSPVYLVDYEVKNVPDSSPIEVDKIIMTAKFAPSEATQEITPETLHNREIRVKLSNGSSMRYTGEAFQDWSSVQPLDDRIPHEGDLVILKPAHKEIEYTYKYRNIFGVAIEKTKSTTDFAYPEYLKKGGKIKKSSSILRMKGSKINSVKYYKYKPEAIFVEGDERAFPVVGVKATYNQQTFNKYRPVKYVDVLYTYHLGKNRLIRD